MPGKQKEKLVRPRRREPRPAPRASPQSQKVMRSTAVQAPMPPPEDGKQGTLLELVLVTADGRYWTGKGWTKYPRKAKRFDPNDPGLKKIAGWAETVEELTGVSCAALFMPSQSL